ncbi:hypothetical protein H0N99_01000 [Candidatus Micrarchaeota archaeon]|nr:hypothetical protein [Candidatus Micrarchaeota archaeon]
MERHAEVPREEKPIRNHIEEVRQKPLLRELANSLKPFELTSEALIFTRHGYASALTESAVKQLEELARMSTKVDRKNVYELNISGVGEILGKVTLVKTFVLPSQDRILAVKRDGDLEIPGARVPRTPLEEYKREEEVKDRSTIGSLLLGVINKHEKRDIELLETFEDRFHEIFVRKGITLDEILSAQWEMVANTGRSAHTKYYDERVKEAGGAVFGTHIHLETLMPSPYDIYTDAGPRQSIEWTGIMLVRRQGWWDTTIRDENFAVFHSDVNDPRWLRKIVKALSDENFVEPYYMQMDFLQENRARMTKYGELLEKLG